MLKPPRRFWVFAYSTVEGPFRSSVSCLLSQELFLCNLKSLKRNDFDFFDQPFLGIICVTSYLG